MEKLELIEQAKAVLRLNDSGRSTRPAPGLYPHQWLWDSCFIAIGISHYDTKRAAQEIYSLLEGQWSNGMIPNMIFSEASDNESARGHRIGSSFWQSTRSPYAPKHKQTSGITQPPMVAEACWRIAKKMSGEEGIAFLKTVYPAIVRYHTWLYGDRDTDGNGLIALFHPWETGLDNTPMWMSELRRVHMPLWIRVVEFFHLEKLLETLFRKDTKYVSADQRISTIEALMMTHVALGLRKRNYDTKRILRRAHFVLESLSYNSILLGNNERLVDIAHKIGEKIPEELDVKFKQARKNLEMLWNKDINRYCHRNYLTGEIIPVEGISQLLPLYSGAINKQRAGMLVSTLLDTSKFWLKFPVPSVPKNSPYFNPEKYWQGPTWINTNWLVIDGLRKYGYENEAEQIRQKSIKLVEKSGFYEYFNPLDGSPAGTNNFSWTAALIIDLLS